MGGRRLGAVLVVGVVLVGCSGGKDAAPETTASTTGTDAPTDTSAVAGATTTTSTIAATTTTVPPPPQVPAGMQFTSAPVAVPTNAYGLISDGTTAIMMGTVDSNISTCPRGVGGCTTVARSPVVHVGTPSGGFTTVQVDDITTYPLPSGFRQPNNGLTSRAIAKGAAGYVMVGNANVWDSDLFHEVASRSLVWLSPDATAWQRIDLRDVVGDTNMFMRDVVATDSGFVAVGEMTGPVNLSSPSTGLVLTSPDGINWTKGADLALPWSVTLQRVVAHGNQVLLRGMEYECTADSSAMNDFSLGGQDRLWSSADGGVTFTAIDLTTTGVATDVPAPATDPVQCADYGARSAYRWSLGFVDQADGTFVLGSSDGSTVASSTDLATWTAAVLPGGTPTAGSSSSGAPIGGQRIATSSADGLFVLSLEKLRDYSGTQMAFGLQVLGWKSTDRGSTFVALPPTRPLKDSQQGLIKQGDGTVAIIANGDDPAGAADVPSLYVSSAGPLVAWGACTPAPAADCAFATLDASAAFTGANLTGIDLSGTSLAGANFDGANLTDALFTGAQLSGASFKNANLTGAAMAGLTLIDVDLTGATLQGTDFTESSLAPAVLQGGLVRGSVLAGTSFTLDPATPVNDVDLSGLDLREASFSAAFGTTGVMQRANFSGSNLVQTLFDNVDLTGSNLAGAILVDERGLSVSFTGTVVCPDGAPVDTTVRGAAACRL